MWSSTFYSLWKKVFKKLMYFYTKTPQPSIQMIVVFLYKIKDRKTILNFNFKK